MIQWPVAKNSPGKCKRVSYEFSKSHPVCEKKIFSNRKDGELRHNAMRKKENLIHRS